MGIKNLIILGLGIAALTWLAAKRYYASQEAITKEVVRTRTVIKRVIEPGGRTIEYIEKDEAANRTITAPKKDKIIVSVLARGTSEDFKPIYGIAVQKEVFGPISLGAFAYEDRVFGLSIGYTF